jgi:hypothetical protein
MPESVYYMKTHVSSTPAVQAFHAQRLNARHDFGAADPDWAY